MYLDGTLWSSDGASIGELQLGPAGMLSLLETQLGLTGLTAHPAARINQYLQRLEAADHDDAWFHASLGADGWSTAKQMLAWRDELIEAGWEGQAETSDSPRLQALAELERGDSPLAPGREDRLREALRRMEDIPSVAIVEVHLVEPLELLPSVWQKVFGQLEDKGVMIEPAADMQHLERSSNLASMQAMLGDEPETETISDGDDSLILVKAADEWEAADNLAMWLAAEAGANQDVTIICGADTDVLDLALQRHGLPQLGDSESSRWRASLQVLPLVLANAWNPVDVQRLVELLSLPMAPIPHYAARWLFRALGQEPGVSGGAWNRALNEIAVEHEEIALKKGQADAQKEAATFVTELDALLATDRYSPETGIPEDMLKQRCQWVIEWLAWRIDSEPMMAEAVSHAREMQKLATGKGNIPRVALERMLDSVIGTGAVAPDRFEQVAPWRVVDHPGQLTRSSRAVIWWGFTEASAKSSVYWSESECESLRRFSIEPEDSKTYRAREARAWRQGFRAAEEHLLLFSPAQIHGEPVYHHPFWDEIHNAAVKAHPDRSEDAVIGSLIQDCSELHDDGSWRLAGRTISLEKAEQAERAAITDTHEIPRNTLVPPASLSYSRMSAMLGCPMNWALKYHARLRVPDTLSIPTGNQMIGSFCHRIVEELYAEPGRQWTPEDAQTKALELYDSLVGSMASELLLDGKELDNKRYRLAMGNAVKQLVAAIDRYGLAVEKTEERLEGDLKGIPFVGFADLVLRDQHGHLFVLDLKWSMARRYYRDLVKEGSALQLATYAWMMRAADGERWPDSGYFLLAAGELISDSALLRDEALEADYSLSEIWERGVEHWNVRFRDVNGGRLEASGVTERLLSEELGLNERKVRSNRKSKCDAQNMVYEQPPCGFCDFSSLCGLAGGD